MTWLTTAALLLSLLSAGAAAASGVQPLLQAENVSVQEGQVCDLTETPNADAILGLEEGTILIRYQSSSSQSYQSLFSVSNATQGNQDRHFHLYVTPGGTLGMELRNTDASFKYTMASGKVLTTGINTVAFSSDADAGVYKLFANGALVAQLQSDDFPFFSDITGANRISLGGTIRNGSVGYPFGGTIHNFQITSELLSDEALCTATAATQYGTKVFHPGDSTQANYFRIPSLLTLENGTVVAAADARYGGTYDSKSNIDIAFSYSTDGGNTWSEPTLPLCFDDYAAQAVDWPTSLLGKLLRIGGSASFIDPLLVQDRESGRLFLFADAMPAGIGSSNASVGSGYKTIDGTQYLKLRWHEDGSNTYNYSVRENGVIYDDTTGQPTQYALNSDFEVLQNGIPLTVKQYEVSISGLILSETKTDTDVAMNVFYQDSLFKVYPTSYLAMVYSDDNGQTWSSMQLLNTLKSDSEKLLITGPGVGIQLQNGAYAGRLVVPVYSVTTAGFGVVYSDDGGSTWNYAAADTSSDGSTAEAQVVELPDGGIRAFIRTSSGYIVERTSIDGGCTWTEESIVSGVASTSYGTQLSVINCSAQVNGSPVILMSTPNSTSGRNTGVIRVGVIRDTGAEGAQRYAVDWTHTKTVDGTLDFSYSCLAELPDGRIGLFYENYDSWDTGSLHTKDALMLEYFDFQQLISSNPS